MSDPGEFRVRSVVPILRMYDLPATLRFYVEYLGCSVDWQQGEGDGPVYLQVSREELRLHLSSNLDDGTPGTAVLVVASGIDVLHAELHSREYPYLYPGIEDGPGSGRTLQLIDPASNRIRFYEPGPPSERAA